MPARYSAGIDATGSFGRATSVGAGLWDGAEVVLAKRNGCNLNSLGQSNILLVDDRTLYREALASTLRTHGAISVRTAWDLSSIIAGVDAAQPSVVLVNTPTRRIGEILSVLLRLVPRTPVIAVAVSEHDEAAIIACAEAGVAGYHMRTDSLADLFALINAAVDGQVSCPPEVSTLLLRRLSTVAADRNPARRGPVLTGREIQILRLLEQGRSNQDIAVRLQIAVHTVKNHVHNLLTKLGVRSRSEAAALSRTLALGRGTQENWPGG